MKFNRLVLLVLVLAFVLAACGGDGESDALPVQGAQAPDFELEDVSGEMVRLSDFQGKAVLINFWATWCPPCQAEMPGINARYQRYNGELVVLAINYEEPMGTVQKFTTAMGLRFDPLLDYNGDVVALYQVRSFPTSFFVDREGVIQVVHIGMLTEEMLDTYMMQLGLE